VLTVGYTMDTVTFSWLEDPVEVVDDLQLPQFELKDTILHDCSQNYTAGMKPHTWPLSRKHSDLTMFTEHGRHWLSIEN